MYIFSRGGRRKSRDLWKDYHSRADVVGAAALPYPEPAFLQNANENPASPKFNSLLPIYYGPVTGCLANAVAEAARYALPGGPRNKPYVAVLQAKRQNNYIPTEKQIRFQAYDAIIHSAKGLLWFDDNDGQPLGPQDTFYADLAAEIRNLLNEFTGHDIKGALTGDYDHTLVAVTTEYVDGQINFVAEESTFVGGKLVPRTHFLSDRVIMEGISKKFDGWTYVIAACRVPPGTVRGHYDVKFRPYFSAYDEQNPWPGEGENHVVYKVGGGSLPVNQDPGGGWWSDTFEPYDVFSYKFHAPAPWQPPAFPPP